MSDLLLAEGVFVTGFGFPVVPQGQARVRCQISAAHTREDLDEALAAFRKVGQAAEADLGRLSAIGHGLGSSRRVALGRAKSAGPNTVAAAGADP